MKMFLSILVFALSAPLFADDTAPQPTENREGVVDQRQENQDNRIEQGAASGQLTNKEENRLNRQQNHINRMEKRAMKDGKMSPGEFRRIERAQNRSSRAIYRKKHNLRHQ